MSKGGGGKSYTITSVIGQGTTHFAARIEFIELQFNGQFGQWPEEKKNSQHLLL